MSARLVTDMATSAGRPYQLRSTTAVLVQRLLLEQGLSVVDAKRGIDYAEAKGARTTLARYVPAMSRVRFTDTELAAAVRFEPTLADAVVESG